MHPSATRSRNVLRPGSLGRDDFFDEDASGEETYCPWCEEPTPTREGRRFCEMHEKRYQRGGKDMSAPKQEKLTPKQRHLEAALRWAEADTDAEYQAAERAVLRTARELAPLASGELVREGMARARQRGVHVGRPLKVSPAQARALVERLGSVTLAAQALGVSRAAVRRALDGGTKGTLSCHADRGTERNERAPSVPPTESSAR